MNFCRVYGALGVYIYICIHTTWIPHGWTIYVGHILMTVGWNTVIFCWWNPGSETTDSHLWFLILHIHIPQFQRFQRPRCVPQKRGLLWVTNPAPQELLLPSSGCLRVLRRSMKNPSMETPSTGNVWFLGCTSLLSWILSFGQVISCTWLVNF